MPTVPTLPPPEQVARREAESIRRGESYLLGHALDRVLADAPFVDRDSLLAGLTAFHRERMAKVPSAAKYPESKPWAEHLLAVDREVQRLAGLSDQQMAILRSLGAYLTFRGFAAAKPVMSEKCRIVYVPESEVGQVHVKNVDDPPTHWKKQEERFTSMPLSDLQLVTDGVGSGLHMDDEPEEVFPLPVHAMLRSYAGDVPGAVEFYTRYRSFWGGGNLVIYDRQKRSVAIEKCSHNFIEVFQPDRFGRSWCSGMACRDPRSPQGRYQRQQRDKYLTMFGQPQDGPDQTFWNACDRAERMLADAVASWPARPSLEQVVRPFRTPWPQGLNKVGAKLHPQQAVEEYTLMTRVYLPDQNRYVQWQRETGTLEMPEEPEVYQF